MSEMQGQNVDNRGESGGRRGDAANQGRTSRTVTSNGVPISDVLRQTFKSRGGHLRDAHLILLGYALHPISRDKIRNGLHRPLGIAETEALFDSLFGDGAALQKWLKDRGIEAKNNAIDDILNNVNVATLKRRLTEDCVKACTSVQLDIAQDTLGHLEAAVESAKLFLKESKGESNGITKSDDSGNRMETSTGGTGG